MLFNFLIQVDVVNLIGKILGLWFESGPNQKPNVIFEIKVTPKKYNLFNYLGKFYFDPFGVGNLDICAQIKARAKI